MKIETAFIWLTEQIVYKQVVTNIEFNQNEGSVFFTYQFLKKDPNLHS